jgi:hypothetical protein
VSDQTSPEARGLWPLQLSVLALAAALVGLTLVHCFELFSDRETLAALRQQQEPIVQESQKLRQQLTALAGRTAQLAQDGDAGARSVVEQMRRQGITLQPPAPNAGPPAK